MELILLFLGIAFLLALNAFFVLAEFAIVKIRPSRITQMIASGDKRAVLLKSIHDNLDEYLSVCQVGITLASVALGMVGEMTSEVIMGSSPEGSLRYVVAIGVSFLLISGSHILLGELVPKSIAIRLSERSALASSKALIIFHKLFFPALWILTLLANKILKIFKIGRMKGDEGHSREELQILLNQYQKRGLLSFRRLLFIENIFDFETMTVKDVMRKREQVYVLDARLPWIKNLNNIKSSRFTRYPLITAEKKIPSSFVHLKDVLISENCNHVDLASLARPLLITKETVSLESVLSEMQRNRIHVALVTNKSNQEWIGLVTFEDILEELIGSIRDEFDDEEHVVLGDIVNCKRVVWGITAESPSEAITEAFSRLPQNELPLPTVEILQEIEDKARSEGVLIESGFAFVQARLKYEGRPLVIIIHLTKDVQQKDKRGPIRIIFVLLTPMGHPRIHHRLQTTIFELLHDSRFVKERLLSASTAEEIINIIRTGEQAALD